MINVKSQLTFDLPLGDQVRGQCVYTFDDGVIITKPIRVSGCALACGYKREELEYQIHRKRKEAIRDWLYSHRGDFGKVERELETVLFRGH